MKSRIVLADAVANRNRRFGAAPFYYPAEIDRGGGRIDPALFTPDQLADAVARAQDNPEDVPARRRVPGWLRAACVAIGAVAIAAGAGVLLLAMAVEARGGPLPLPRCGSVPHPPHVIVLPDGTEVPAQQLTYRGATRRWEVTGYDRIHCGGFEAGEAP